MSCIKTFKNNNLYSFDIIYDKDINNVATKFNHNKIHDVSQQLSFAAGQLKGMHFSIYAVSAPRADIIYHFFKENFSRDICELKSITYHRYPWRNIDLVYYQELGTNFPEFEIAVIDSDKEYGNLVKFDKNNTEKSDIGAIVNYMLGNEKIIERIDLLNSRFDKKYISKKLYFNYVGSYARVKINSNE